MNTFLVALAFFTRIPVERYCRHSQDALNRCNRFFPIVGTIIGSIGAIIFWLSSLILPIDIAIILSMVATIMATGAFHEDGFADMCDGFGGGWTKEQIMSIMKDSRIGTYGTVAIVFLLGTKFALLRNANCNLIPLMLIVGHTLSRLMATFAMYALKYVRGDELSKSKPIAKNLHYTDLIIATITGLSTIIIMPNWLFALALLPMAIALILMCIWFKKRIGGYVGDCLGGLQQVCEITFYTACIVIETKII